jgi:type IV pilus biogenesis protein CpaD/CtpE
MGYSIIKKADHEFVVSSEEQSVLKCTSRRKAAKTIADANDLMHIKALEPSDAKSKRALAQTEHRARGGFG